MGTLTAWLRRLQQLFRQTAINSLDDDQVTQVNTKGEQRNWVVVVSVLLALLAALGIFRWLTTPTKVPVSAEPVDFGAIITPDFSVKDSQSALQAQQADLLAQKKQIDRLEQALASANQRNEILSAAVQEVKSSMQEALMQIRNEQEESRQASQFPLNSANKSEPADPFGHSPPSPDHHDPRWLLGKDLGAQQDSQASATRQVKGIEVFSCEWDVPSDLSDKKRTTKNYVPSGSFVTAVLTGGADANAGINGQGDTAPIVFRTINNGFLPNGYQSRLKGCTITASTYGEVSSSRGIVRTDRLSCVFGDDEIIDIPVRGTAFNFGRNGIRGTVVMRNGKIVEMAGVAGLFTGLGNTARTTSQTVTTSAMGATTVVDPSKALLNMGGNALESVGSKLADYYIKLASQYHPIVELNPGNVVNVVFLEGFPLESEAIKHYEQKAARASTSSPVAQAAPVAETLSNPLAERLPEPIRPDTKAAFHQQSQQVPNAGGL